MPIYDYDGTTNYQIGRVYDDDGTTHYQIGRVYENDGTTSHLIYSTEMNALTEAAFISACTSGCSMTQSSTQLYLYAGYGDSWLSAWYAAAYIPINFSNYSKATVTYSYSGNYNRYMGFGFGTNTNFTDSSDLSTVIRVTFDTGVHSALKMNPTGSGTVVLDMSSLSGSGYFKAAVCHSSQADCGRMYLTQILFE